MASLLDFEYNNGEYKKFDEDVTKGYVEDKTGFEAAGFEANSEKMYKVVKEYRLIGGGSNEVSFREMLI